LVKVAYLCVVKEQVTDKQDALLAISERLALMEQTVYDQGAEISRLNRLVDQKDKTIRDLKQRLSKYEEPPKDSQNSSIPPTQDTIKNQIVRHTSSLRKKSGRHTGGQPGHEGHFLETVESPDFTVPHCPGHVCECCGESLDGVEAEVIGTSQVVDIPPVRPVTTEHVLYGKRCTCGHMNRCKSADKYTSRISYGRMVRALVAYLGHVQYVPFKRLCGILHDVFGLDISEGTVQNILRRMGMNSESAYREIRDRIEEAEVAGGDETGMYAGGEHNWGWTFQTRFLTYLFRDKSRGKAATRKHFPNDLPNTTLVTDRHGTYFKLNVKAHQVCIAHLLRNIQYLTQLDAGQDWSTRLTSLLQEAIHLRKTETWSKVRASAAGFYKRLDRLLSESLDGMHKDFGALKKGLLKCRDFVFTFLTDQSVPYDNNASERAVRNIKVKQKVSGCFRTGAGADIYLKLQSLTDTARKNGNSKFDVLLALADL